MEMRHFLMAVGAGIGDGAVAGDVDAGQFADLGDGAGEGDDLGIRGLGRKILEGFVSALRDDQDMSLGLGADIAIFAKMLLVS